jgi:hypothetical protein
MPEQKECDICTLHFTKSTRKELTCPYEECGKSYCLECFQNFVKESFPRFRRVCCMECRQEIPITYIIKNCPKSFNKEVLAMRSDVREEEELNELPNTQDQANLVILVQNYHKERQIYLDRIRELDQVKREIVFQMQRIPYPNINHVRTMDEGGGGTKASFIHKCPVPGCEGFLSSSYKCGMCSTHVCSKCLVPKDSRNDPDHVCNPDDVKSVELVKKNTKPCPGKGCGVPIAKKDGCNQMWCIRCKTAWDWATGRIENGYIHNPEYFRYLRENGIAIDRNPDDVPRNGCERLPTVYTLRGYLDAWHREYDHQTEKGPLVTRIWEIYRLRTHVNQVIARPLRINYEEKYEKNRVDKLLKKVDDETFKKKIKNLVKLEEKNNSYLEHYNTFHTVSGHIIRNISDILKNRDVEKEYVVERVQEQVTSFDNLKRLCNENLNITGKFYGNKVKLI